MTDETMMARADPVGAKRVPNGFTNPFYYGKEVRGVHFFNRTEELEVLGGLLRGEPPFNVALVGPRRIGKTSLMRALAERLAADTIPLFIRCELELYPHRPGAFALGLTRKVAEAIEAENPPPWQARLSRKVKSALPAKVGVSYKDLQVWARWRERDPSELLERAFAALGKLQQASGLKPVVFLDEFQELFGFGKEFLWALRAHLADSSASFVVCSSATRFVDQLRDSAHPFFNFFDLREVGQVTQAEAREYLIARLAETTLEITPEALELLLEQAGGHPYYLQLLASSACEVAYLEGKSLIEEQTTDLGFERALDRIPPYLAGQYLQLKGRTQDLFRALCAGYEKVGELARAAAMSSSVASQLLSQLAGNSELIEKVERGRYRVVDRLLAAWVAREYPLELE